MGGWSKDGSFYKDNNELRRADNKWLQQEQQNKLLEEQNNLKRKEIEEQNWLMKQSIENQNKIEEQRRFNEVLRRIELEEQTKIQREEQYRNSLNDEDKELYSNQRELLIEVNSLRTSAVETIYNMENELEELQFDLYTRLNKVNSIGFNKYAIKFIILFLLGIVSMYMLINFLADTEMLWIIGMFAVMVIVVSPFIEYSIKNRKYSKEVSMIRKDIKKFVNKIINMTKIEVPEEVAYIHQIGIRNVDKYVHKVTAFQEELYVKISEINNMKKDITNRINQIEDELNEIYKKPKRKEDSTVKDK